MFKYIFAAMAIAAATIALSPSVTAQQPSPSPAPSASASPSLAPSTTPSAIPSAAPSATPSPTPTPTPSATPLATPTPLPTPLTLPPDAPPQILAVQLSDPVFHSGEHVTGTIITSTNVAAVEIRMMGRARRIPRTDFGVFEMSYTLPRIPFWMRKTYTAQVIAMNTAGVEAERDVTVSVR